MRAAFATLPRFENRRAGGLRAFLHRLVRSKLADRARQLASAKRRGEQLLPSTEIDEFASPQPRYVDPRYEQLERGLRQLPPEMREAIQLRRFDGLSSKEIAQRTGRSDAAVRKAYSRAIARLALLTVEDAS